MLQHRLYIKDTDSSGVLPVKSYLPPKPSIRCLSLGSSGLWSCVTSTALMNGSDGSSWTPRTTAESPTWATYMRFPLITTMLAVVPDVLGRPVSVFGHSAKIEYINISYKIYIPINPKCGYLFIFFNILQSWQNANKMIDMQDKQISLSCRWTLWCTEHSATAWCGGVGAHHPQTPNRSCAWHVLFADTSWRARQLTCPDIFTKTPKQTVGVCRYCKHWKTDPRNNPEIDNRLDYGVGKKKIKWNESLSTMMTFLHD